MIDFLTKLFDSSGSVARCSRGGWTAGLVGGLHHASEARSWLSSVAIPIVLVSFARRRDLALLLVGGWRHWRDWALVLVIASIYFGAAKLGLAMAFVAEQVTAVWPPTGIALASLLLFGNRLWPGVALGAFVANATHNEPLLTAGGIAVGNTLEGLVGAYLLRRVVDFRNSLDRFRDVLGFVALAAGLSTLVSATIGTASLCLGGVEPWARFGPIWWVWWVGDAMGDLVVAPLLLVWAARPQSDWQGRQVLEASGLFIALIAVSQIVFGDGLTKFLANYSLEYVVFPLVIWTAIRFGQPGTTLSTVVVSGIAIWNTQNGFGPFATGTANENLLLFQTFMGAVAVTGLALAAVTSERTCAENALRDSESRIKFTLDAAHVGTWDWNMISGEVRWSENLAAIHGLAPGTFAGTFDGFIKEVHPEDRQRVLQAIDEASKAGTDYDVEYRQVRPDGSVGWTAGKGRVIFDDGGRPMRMNGVCMDITQRKRADEALRASDALKQAMLEAALDCIITIDHEGKVVEWNPASEATFGYTRAQAIGRPLSELVVPPRLRDSHRQGLARYLATSEGPVLNKRIELPAIRSDGTEFPVEIAIVPIAREGPPMFTGYIRDITERKRTEEQIRTLNAELEERVSERTAELQAANKELESFSYSVSHDLRAPLRCIDGFSKALLEDCSDRLDEQGHDHLRRIRAAAQRMGELIDVLLALSRLSRVEMRRQEVNLSAIAGTVAREHQEREPERRVEILIEDERVGNGDPQLLRVVLENLLSNAWKFTSKHLRARIEFGALQQDGKLVYFVRDNGVGFDMAYADMLFRPFQRLHQMSEFPGFGIGLATVQHIISRHGGRVWAEAAVDKGAAFLFTL
jgi:PAS domain S-box-containing protein